MVAGVIFEDVCARGTCVRLSVGYRCSRGVRENGRLNLGSADWPIRDCFHVTCGSQFTLLFSLSVSLSSTLILKCLRLYHYPICLFQYLFPFFFLSFNLFSPPHLPSLLRPLPYPSSAPQFHISPLPPCCSFVIQFTSLSLSIVPGCF